MDSSLTREPFGRTASGVPVERFTLANSRGASVSILTYGGTLTTILVPDRSGKLADVTLGYDTLAEYEKGDAYFGALIGRYANRIARGRFSIDGAPYQLACNNGTNHLHGGPKGFHRVVWKATTEAPGTLHLSHVSPDGEEGYPGELTVAMMYRFDDACTLRMEYAARTTKPTVVNLTNHAYFNLRGGGDVRSHLAKVCASAFTPSDANLVPTGELAPVAGTPMDYRDPKPIGRDFPQLTNRPVGVDHNFVLDTPKGQFGQAARVVEPESGRSLEVWTDQPGVQFYSGNFLGPATPGKQGALYPQHGGFCLETQHFPDGPNQPSFPNTILRPGEVFRSVTEYRFGVA